MTASVVTVGTQGVELSWAVVAESGDWAAIVRGDGFELVHTPSKKRLPAVVMVSKVDARRAVKAADRIGFVPSSRFHMVQLLRALVADGIPVDRKRVQPWARLVIDDDPRVSIPTYRVVNDVADWDVVRASDYATWREATARAIVQGDEVTS